MARFESIGDLIKQVRATGINPDGTGTSPYGGVEAGTNDPVANPGIDDIHEDTKITIGKYLSGVTKGNRALQEKNAYPIQPDQTPMSLVDEATGNPAPLSNISSDQAAFAGGDESMPGQEDINNAYDTLSEFGFFTMPDMERPDKNDQVSGHTLNNSPDMRDKVSEILSSNRFSTISNPDAPYSVPTLGIPGSHVGFQDGDGLALDPLKDKLGKIALHHMATGKRPAEAYPDAKLKTAGDDEDPFGNRAELEYGEFAAPSLGDHLLPTQLLLGPAGEYKDPSDGSKPSYGSSYTPTFTYESMAQAPGIANIVDVLFQGIGASLEFVLEGLEGLVKDLPGPENQSLTSNNPAKPWTLPPGRNQGSGNYSPATQIDNDGNPVANDSTFISAANRNKAFYSLMGIPVPKFINEIRGNEPGVPTMVKFGLASIRANILADESALPFYRAWAQRLGTLISLENNFGLPRMDFGIVNSDVGSATLAGIKLVQMGVNFGSNERWVVRLSECNAMRLIRSLAIIGTVSAVSSVMDQAAKTYRFSGEGNLNDRKNTAQNRHGSGRILSSPEGAGSAFGSLSHRNMPSLLLLPKAFTTGRDVMGLTLGTPVLTPNHVASGGEARWRGLLQLAFSVDKSEPTPEGSALKNKLGKPLKSIEEGGNANRFSAEEVEAMENVLEAEHIPFYFHDLRTNEIVSFHAFLNTLSDSFSPSFKASSGFGRIEDVQIYEKTSRAISVDFTMAAMNEEDMDELYYKLNRLIAMVYPQFSRGTLLEHDSAVSGGTGVTRFVQPFSQVTTATPIIRLRVGDLIKGNYSRETVGRLMGPSDDQFTFVEATQDDLAPELDCAGGVSEVYSRIHDVPISEIAGEYDNTRGWPIGSVVIVDPSYSPLVSFDSGTQTASSDWSATIHTGKFGVEILEYISFNNPLGQCREIIIKVKLANSPIAGFPQSSHIATLNSDQSLITTGMLSYSDILHQETANLFCAGLNKDIFQDIADRMIPPADYTAEQTATFNASVSEKEIEIREILFGDKNPIFKSFETTKGRGLAGIINSLSIDWGLNSDFNWDINPGRRAPMGCKVSIGFTPIHDVVPGLDADGMMRSVVYGVGRPSKSINGDPHLEPNMTYMFEDD